MLYILEGLLNFYTFVHWKEKMFDDKKSIQFLGFFPDCLPSQTNRKCNKSTNFAVACSFGVL